MKKFGIYVLVVVMLLGTLTSCDSDSETSTEATVVKSISTEFPNGDDETIIGSKQYPADAVEGFTLDGYEGKIEYKVVNCYVGDNCDSKLTELGEDLDSYYFDSDYKHVLYEVKIKVDKLNNDTEKLTASDVIFTDIYDTKKKEIDESKFYNVGFVDAAKKDLNQNSVKLKVSEDSVTLYQLVEMSQDIDEFYSKMYDKDGNAFWALYPVKDL